MILQVCCLSTSGQGFTQLTPLGQSQGFISSFVTKVVNNLQITVHNIHIRYEDDMSCPGVRSISICQILI